MHYQKRKNVRFQFQCVGSKSGNYEIPCVTFLFIELHETELSGDEPATAPKQSFIKTADLSFHHQSTGTLFSLREPAPLPSILLLGTNHLQTMVSTARAAAVVMAVAVVSAARLAHAAVLPGEPDVISVLVPSTARGRHDSSGSKLVSPRNEYMHDLNPELVSLLQQTLPEIRDIRIVDGPDGPRLDMPLSGCRDSLDCHHRFTNYLGLLVRMMETGKRRK
ncbi:uncharacterized protein [Penaeus vannamei]|uniref:uncharacterized protein n=1 Tax=Penaeus vannamei TaxID=6689 RepID=UPI00387F63D3